VNDEIILQGRKIGPPELAQVRALLTDHPDWSRPRISQHLATLWQWRNPAGQLKDMAARTLLLKLAQRGWIALPARRQVPSNRMRRTTVPALPANEPDPTPISGPLAELLPLTLYEVSTEKQSTERAHFAAWLYHHHYLSYGGSVGENLQYLARDQHGRALACLLFGAAAWQCRPRDEHIGWEASTRQQRLGLITNNTRFLILPWVRVKSLASHVLGRIARRLSGDWQAKYGHPIYLLETFVDTSRFAGHCYRAANWVCVGQTTGRTRQNKTMIPTAPPKAVWLYPLTPDYRSQLCAP
jgi:hypothetical protein